jgi:transposase-like protein
VILTAVRWYASYPLSATHVMQLLAERHIDVSARTVLNWVQTFGPQLAKALQRHRRRWGRQSSAVTSPPVTACEERAV